MKKEFIVAAALILVASAPWQAKASTLVFSFSGAGVNGTVSLTYGTVTDGKYPQGFAVTQISGTFSDSNNGLGIVNASIGPLVAINPTAPDPTNLLAPDDFSKFAVASGLPAQSGGDLTYDNLVYPGPGVRRQPPQTIPCTADCSIFTACSSILVTAKWWTCGALAPRPEPGQSTTV